MAVVKGIEISGDIYDIEDESARTSASEASTTASEAKTAVQETARDLSDLGGRVEGIASQANMLEAVIGDVDIPLDTTAQTLIGAVNELASGGSAYSFTGVFRVQCSPNSSETLNDAQEIKILGKKLADFPNGSVVFIRCVNANAMNFYNLTGGGLLIEKQDGNWQSLNGQNYLVRLVSNRIQFYNTSEDNDRVYYGVATACEGWVDI